MLYPLFLKLEGVPVLVVGAGTIALHKIESLLDCGASVSVVAPDACESVLELVRAGRVAYRTKRFHPEDVDGMRLVVAATSDAAVNDAVKVRCRELGVWINVVDDPERCDFYVPSVVRRGGVQVAISTGGASPALARVLKGEIGALLEPSLGRYAELVSRARDRIKLALAKESYEVRRAANEAVLASDARRRLAEGDEEGAEEAIERVLADLEGRRT